MPTDNKSKFFRQTSAVKMIETCDPYLVEDRYKSIVDALTNKRQIALLIEATSTCNLTCSHCGMHSGNIKRVTNEYRPLKKINTINIKLFESIINKCHGSDKIKALYLHGHGEPLLHKELSTLIYTAKGSKMFEQIILVTNGTLLNIDTLHSLVQAGVDSFRISLDVFDNDKYLAVKGKDLSHQVILNIEKCLSEIRNCKLSVTFSIECMNWLDNKSDLNFETNKIITHFKKSIEATPGASIRLRDEFNWLERLEKGDKQFVRSVPCEQAFYIFFIHSDGDISMCCGDASKSLTVGNINEFESLSDVMNCNKVHDIRKKLLLQDFAGIEVCRVCRAATFVDKYLGEKRVELLDILENNTKL